MSSPGLNVIRLTLDSLADHDVIGSRERTTMPPAIFETLEVLERAAVY